MQLSFSALTGLISFPIFIYTRISLTSDLCAPCYFLRSHPLGCDFAAWAAGWARRPLTLLTQLPAEAGPAAGGSRQGSLAGYVQKSHEAGHLLLVLWQKKIKIKSQNGETGSHSEEVLNR
jgi:hypothetical protein